MQWYGHEWGGTDREIALTVCKPYAPTLPQQMHPPRVLAFCCCVLFGHHNTHPSASKSASCECVLVLVSEY